jgi:hypothetical protein
MVKAFETEVSETEVSGVPCRSAAAIRTACVSFQTEVFGSSLPVSGSDPHDPR